MRILKITLLASLIVSGGAAACAVDHQMEKTNEAARRPMGSDQIRALLLDAYVTPVLAPGLVVDHPRGEAFRSGGLYIRTLNRTTVEGVYKINDSLVCVEGAGFRTLCRRVIDEGNNTYTFVDVSDGTSVLMKVTHL